MKTALSVIPPMDEPRALHMTAEGKALLMRTKSPKVLQSPLVFDVLSTLEHDMQQAAKGKSVALADWTGWLKKGEDQRAAFMQAFILIVAMAGLSSRDIAKVRRDLMNVTPSRRRRPRLIHGPEERQTRGLF